MPTASPCNRRKGAPAWGWALLCGAALGLAGCSSDNDTAWTQITSIAKMAWNNDSSITLQQAASVPYASLAMRVGDGPQRMIVMASDSGSDRLWTSAARVALITQNGRVVRTSGFGNDLNATNFAGGDPLADFQRGETQARSTHRSNDFWNLNKYSVNLNCTMTSRGEEDVVILGTRIRTRRIEEHCDSSALNWSFDNVFWIGAPNGMVWRSIQNLHPDLSPVEIEVLRPPADGNP